MDLKAAAESAEASALARADHVLEYMRAVLASRWAWQTGLSLTAVPLAVPQPRREAQSRPVRR
jgi:hypothetical protein